MISNVEKVLSIMKQTGDKTGEAELHRQLGITYYGIGKYENAIKHLKEGLALAKDIGDKRYEGTAYQNLGGCYISLGQYEKVMSSLHESLKIAKEIGDKSGEGAAYRNLGVCYKSLGQYDDAISHLQQGLEIAKEIGDKDGEGAAYRNLGVYYKSLGQYNDAISHLQKGLKIAKEIGNKSGEGAAYRNLGVCCQSIGQYDDAISHLQKGLKIAKEIGNKSGEEAAYHNLGVCCQSLGQYDDAISHLQKGLKIAKEIGDKSGEGAAYRNLGVCCQSLGQYDDAISHLEKGLKIAKEIGDKSGEGAAYHNLGVCRESLGQYDDAISHLQKDLKIAKEIGEKSGEGAAYHNLGVCCQSLGQYDETISHLQKALKIAQEIGDKSGEGAAYQNLGVCRQSLGQYDDAISHLQKALKIAQEIGDKNGEGAAYRNLGVCHQSLGQYDDAISHLQKALKIAEEIGNKRGEGAAYHNLGGCRQSLGQYDDAISHLQKALKIAKEIGNKSGEGAAYRILGVCRQFLGQYDDAISHLQKALKIAKEIGNKRGEGAAYHSLGCCRQSLGQYDDAISHLQKGLKIAKEIGDKSGEGAAYHILGVCRQSLGQYDDAISYLQKGVNVAKQIGNKSSEGVAYYHLGAMYESVREGETAEGVLRNSVSCFIELFNNAPNLDADRVSFIDTFMNACDKLIDNLVCQGKADEALIVAEDCRAMSLKYLMNSANFVPISSHPNQLNLQEIREMSKSPDNRGVIFFALPHSKICTWIIHGNGQIGLFNTQIGEQLDKENSVKILVNQLLTPSREVKVGCFDSSLTERETTGAMRQRFFHANARFASRVLVDILFKLIENKPVRCDDRSLSFLHPEVSRPTEEERKSVLPQMETIFTQVCKTSRSPRAQRSPISPGAQDLQQQGTPEMATDQGNRETRTEFPQTGELMQDLLAFLYKLLLDPVREHIAGSQVVIVPDGPLALVPFAALVDENGRYVAESGARIRLVPSLAAADVISKRPRNPIRKSLIIGDPHVGEIIKDGNIIPVEKIPSAVKEAKLIGRVLRCKPLTGRQATKKEFLRNVESADLIHIAAHGDAERGEILLAAPSGTNEDQAVPVDEVMLKMTDLETKRIQAQLVVLSSCYSARGKVQGEGVVGMARAFLGAGARAVLVTLWAVDDSVTYPLMGIFYGGLLDGKSASEALSDAMKVVRESQEVFRHPRFWAPFILLGDDVRPLGKQGSNIQTPAGVSCK